MTRDSNQEASTELSALLDTMRMLLSPEGCAWDREQTLHTLGPYLLEETYEVLEAIADCNKSALREELGDLLFQVVFLAALAQKEYDFGFADVARGIRDKLVRRHPHVFSGANADNVEEAIRSWEAAKARERAGKSALEGVPKVLPSLLRAQRTLEKVEGSVLGIDVRGDAAASAQEAIKNLFSLLEESSSAVVPQTLVGEALFALVKVAHSKGIDAESALRAAVCDYSDRFRRQELSS